MQVRAAPCRLQHLKDRSVVYTEPLVLRLLVIQYKINLMTLLLEILFPFQAPPTAVMDRAKPVTAVSVCNDVHWIVRDGGQTPLGSMTL